MNRYGFRPSGNMRRAYTSQAMPDAYILFAHGARDPRWREPFERLADKVRAARPGAAVTLAFLELMTPDLPAAVDALAAQGRRDMTVVPIFLGQGGHVREDLPAAVAQAQSRQPGVTLTLRPAIGEDDAVLEAIAHAVLGAR